MAWNSEILPKIKIEIIVPMSHVCLFRHVQTFEYSSHWCCQDFLHNIVCTTLYMYISIQPCPIAPRIHCWHHHIILCVWLCVEHPCSTQDLVHYYVDMHSSHNTQQASLVQSVCPQYLPTHIVHNKALLHSLLLDKGMGERYPI